MKSRLTLLLAALLLFSGCNDNQMIEAFSLRDQIRLEVDGVCMFAYTPEKCQLSFNRQNGQFRAHTDSMSDYFIIEDMSDIPTEEGQEIIADIIWTTRNDIMARKKITLKVIRLQGDKVWLWSSYGRIGAELRILD